MIKKTICFILIIVGLFYIFSSSLFVFEYKIVYGRNFEEDRFGFGRERVFTNRRIKHFDDLAIIDSFFKESIGNTNTFTVLEYDLIGIIPKHVFNKEYISVINLDKSFWFNGIDEVDLNYKRRGNATEG